MKSTTTLLIIMSLMSSMHAQTSYTYKVSELTKQNRPHEWACEPSIAADPNSFHIVAGSVLDQVHTNAFPLSADWHHQTLTSTYGVYGDPILQYDNAGRVYFLHLANPSGKAHQEGDWLDRIVIKWSDDHGATWNNGSGIGYNPPKDQDKEGISIDPFSHTLHVSWTEFDKYGEADRSLYRSRIRYAQSEDRGETWSIAVTLSSHEGDCVDDDKTTEGAIPAVDPLGGVSVIWSVNDTLWFNRSDDDGATTWFGHEIPFASQRGGWAQEIPGFGRANGMPISMYDRSGRLHLVFGEQDGDSSWVAYQYSDNRGRYWSPKQVIPRPAGVVHHFMPWFTVDTMNQNALHIMAYGQQDTVNWTTQAYHTVSHDGGKTWQHHALAEAFQPAPKAFFGDYNGITAGPMGVHMVWTQQKEGENSVYYGWYGQIEMAKDPIEKDKRKKSKR